MKVFYILIFGVTVAQAQPPEVEWSRIYDIDHNLSTACYSVCLAHDSGFLMSGWRSSRDGLLFHVSASGDSQWISNEYQEAHQIQAMPQGGYVFTQEACVLRRVEDSLQLTWSYVPPEGFCGRFRVELTPDGGFLLAGSRGPFNPFPGDFDGFVIRLNSSGQDQWATLLDQDTINYFCTDACQTEDGGYFAVGAFGHDGLLVKMSEDGDSIWQRTYDGVTFSFVLPLADGGAMAAGRNVGNGIYNVDMQFLRFDANGDIVWQRSYGGDDEDRCIDLVAVSGEGYLLLGSVGAFGDIDRDVWLVRTDDNGDTLWTLTVGIAGSRSDWPTNLLQTADGGFVFSGNTVSEDWVTKWWLVKLGPELSVTDPERTTARDYKLMQNYPNPFNPVTEIAFDLPQASDVQLTVFDLLGREVKTLVNEKITAGQHDISFDASSLPSGLYIYRLQAGDFVQSQKMILLK